MWKGSRQQGWKVVGVTQTQPKAGYVFRLELDIPPPDAVFATLEPKDIVAKTDTDRAVQQIVDDLDNGEGVI
jgi:hypothetical protein